VKSLLAVLALAASVVYVPAIGSQTSQQERLSSCGAVPEGKKLAGAARQRFVDNCVSGKEQTAPLASPQQKFRTCRLKAVDQTLSGDARKEFTANCNKK
jgi:hypothetical protein